MPLEWSVGSVEELVYYMEVEIVVGEGAVLVVNEGHPVATNGILCVRGGDAAHLKLLWDFWLLLCFSS